MWAGCILGFVIHFRYSLFEVKDDFISPVVIQTFRMAYFDLILKVFLVRMMQWYKIKCSVKFFKRIIYV